MAFIESPSFPQEVAAWLVGGEEFNTDIAMTQSSAEQRNQVWATPLRRYRLSNGLRTIPNANATKAFFRAAGGRANGFRVKDIFDYTCDLSNGALGTGVGNGTPTYQLQKKYISGSITSFGKISKPVVSKVAPYRNGVAMTQGVALGNWNNVDTTTGIVTLVQDASTTCTAVVVGATTKITMPVVPASLVVGKKIYLAGFTGVDAALINNAAHTISVITGTGPYVVTIPVDTTGKVITFTGGIAYAYPQASDTLAWVGEFDIPVRFDVDWLQVGVDTGLMLWDNITLQELRL